MLVIDQNASISISSLVMSISSLAGMHFVFAGHDNDAYARQLVEHTTSISALMPIGYI